MTNDNDRITDLQSYPILTEEVGTTPARRTGGTGARLDQIIESALQEILGWRPRTGDPKGFVAALTQSFSLEEQEGRRKWTWTPHTYTIQADLGAVTGAQASIYTRAKVVLDESLPLLEGLESLLPDADVEDTDASKAIVESSLTELVNEMGLVGGPRVQRVDSYFETLLGPRDPDDPKKIEDDPEKVAGQLGALRDRLGLDRGRVNTVAEEQTLTNFRVLVDYIVALARSWNSQKHFFDRDPKGTDVFLGTQLVLLARELAVLAESVQEAYFAMDSVFLRDAERQAIRLPLGDKEARLTIAELLDWIDRFATDEGPRLIREAGKDGVIAFRSTVHELLRLVGLALNPPPSSDDLPEGFLTPRVQRTFKELKQHLQTTARLAEQLKRDPPPSLSAVDPDQGAQDQTVQVTLHGENFQDGAEVRLTRNDTSPDGHTIPDQNIRVVSSTQIRADFDLTGVDLGAWTVVVTSPAPDGQSSSREPSEDNVFTVIAPLNLSGVNPGVGSQGATDLDVTLTVAGLQRGATADFGPGITVTSPAFDGDPSTAQEMTATINIDDVAPLGPRDVTVSNPDGQSNTLPDSFSVNATEAPTVDDDGANPDSGNLNQILTVEITGTGFQAGASVEFGQGITILDTEVVSDTLLRVTIAITAAAQDGSRVVRVTNSDDQSGENQVFDVGSGSGPTG